MIFQECGVTYCPICKLDKKVRHIKVRGLCEKSMFNSVYILTLNQDGNAIYLGQYTSSIVFNKTEQVWQWFDQKDSKSVAIRWFTKPCFKQLTFDDNHSFFSWLMVNIIQYNLWLESMLTIFNSWHFNMQSITWDYHAPGSSYVWLHWSQRWPLHRVFSLQTGSSNDICLWLWSVHLQWWTMCLHRWEM